MVFISKNLFRKCKYCEKERKKNITKLGRHKGYYRTCGSKKCVTQQYRDNSVNRRKGRVIKGKERLCLCCDDKFISVSANHKSFCKECVPTREWAAKAQRYLVGKKRWEQLLIKQNNTCALCDKNAEVVDHCHRTSKVRGLLCVGCNTLVGAFDKDKIWFQKALKYTEMQNAF